MITGKRYLHLSKLLKKYLRKLKKRKKANKQINSIAGNQVENGIRSIEELLIQKVVEQEHHLFQSHQQFHLILDMECHLHQLLLD